MRIATTPYHRLPTPTLEQLIQHGAPSEQQLALLALLDRANRVVEAMERAFFGKRGN